MIYDIDLSDVGGSLSASQDAKWVTGYKYVFTVLTNNGADDAYYIRRNISYPYPSTPITVGTVHPNDANAYVTGIEVDFVSTIRNNGFNGAMWTATVTYGEFNPLEMVENPLNMPVYPSKTSQIVERVADVDKDGNPIVNAVGDPYDPPLMTKHTIQIYRFTKNYATLPGYLSFEGYINNATWQGFDPFTVEFSSANYDELPSQYLGHTYFKVDFEMAVDRKTWLAKLPNYGYRQKIGGSGNPVPIIVGGQPATTPQFLSATGAYVAPPITSSNLVINTFHYRDETDFGAAFTDFPVNLFANYRNS